VLVHLVVGLFEGFLHYNSVHGAAKVELDFEQDGGGLEVGSGPEVLGRGSVVQNTAHLLGVEFWQLLLRHQVHEEVVSDLGVSIDPLGVSLGDTLRKNTGVLRVEQQVDPGELNVLAGTIPVASVDVSLLVIAVNQDGSPLSGAVRVAEETFTADGVEATVFSLAKSDPLMGHAAVVLSIIKRLKGEPVSWVDSWVAVVNSL